VVSVFAVGRQSLIIYFLLKALGSILKILMEMEFNSRGVAKTKKRLTKRAGDSATPPEFTGGWRNPPSA
jgi:choline-glycine betaine transporter